jgi:hypothetical protein
MIMMITIVISVVFVKLIGLFLFRWRGSSPCQQGFGSKPIVEREMQIARKRNVVGSDSF